VHAAASRSIATVSPHLDGITASDSAQVRRICNGLEALLPGQEVVTDEQALSWVDTILELTTRARHELRGYHPHGALGNNLDS